MMLLEKIGDIHGHYVGRNRKKQFEIRYQSIADILTVIKKCGKEITHGLVLKL